MYTIEIKYNNTMVNNIYDKLIYWLLNINQNIRDNEINTLNRV